MTILVNVSLTVDLTLNLGGGGNWPTATRSGKILENKVQLRGPVGVSSSVPRVPWYDFCCLEYKNIAHTANFLLWAICPPPQALSGFLYEG